MQKFYLHPGKPVGMFRNQAHSQQGQWRGCWEMSPLGGGPGYDAKYLRLLSGWISLGLSDMSQGQVGKLRPKQGSRILSYRG